MNSFSGTWKERSCYILKQPSSCSSSSGSAPGRREEGVLVTLSNTRNTKSLMPKRRLNTSQILKKVNVRSVSDDKRGEEKSGRLESENVRTKTTSENVLNKRPTGRRHKFSMKLMLLLEIPKYKDIISWNSSGDSVIIHQPESFETDVLPAYFHTTTNDGELNNFLRKLTLWGFKCVIQSSDSTSLVYRHKNFRRGEYLLCKEITLTNSVESSPMRLPISTSSDAPRTLSGAKKKHSFPLTSNNSPQNLHAEKRPRGLSSGSSLISNYSDIENNSVAPLSIAMTSGNYGNYSSPSYGYIYSSSPVLSHSPASQRNLECSTTFSLSPSSYIATNRIMQSNFPFRQSNGLTESENRNISPRCPNPFVSPPAKKQHSIVSEDATWVKHRRRKKTEELRILELKEMNNKLELKLIQVQKEILKNND